MVLDVRPERDSTERDSTERDLLLGQNLSATTVMDFSRPDWYIPNWAPRSSNVISALLVFSSCITSTVRRPTRV